MSVVMIVVLLATSLVGSRLMACICIPDWGHPPHSRQSRCRLRDVSNPVLQSFGLLACLVTPRAELLMDAPPHESWDDLMRMAGCENRDGGHGVANHKEWNEMIRKFEREYIELI